MGKNGGRCDMGRKKRWTEDVGEEEKMDVHCWCLRVCGREWQNVDRMEVFFKGFKACTVCGWRVN